MSAATDMGSSEAQRAAANARQRAWSARNRDLINARNKTRYYEDRERIRARQNESDRRIAERARAGDRNVHAKYLFDLAKNRARRNGTPFGIALSDIVIPDLCPVLGIPLKMNRGRAAVDSATIDRIVPAIGYVPGNIVVVSMRANAIKSNYTIGELLTAAVFYAGLLQE